MGTIAQKLSYVRETVNQFEDKSIDLFGKDFIENATFRELANEYKNLWTNWPNKAAGEGASLILENTKKGKMQIQSIGNTTQKTSILPDEYQQVEYIESTGTQYIDTEIFTKNTLKIECMCKFTEENGRNGSIYAANQGWVSWGAYSTGGLNALFCSRDRQGAIIDYDNNFHKYILQNGLQKIDNIETNITTDTMPETLKIYLFAFSNNYSSTDIFAKEMIKYCKIYNNNDLIRDFIPCYRKSDNEIGLYDLVNNVFYTNNGTGTFNKGNDVSILNPDYPQVIKNITGNNKVVIRGKNISPVNSKNIIGTTSSSKSIGGIPGTVIVKDVPIKNATYTLSATKPNEVSGLVVFLYNDKLKANSHNSAYIEVVSSGQGIQIAGNKPISVTDDYKYLAITTGNDSSYSADTEVIINITDIQIEENSTASDFEPHIKPIEKSLNLGDIELCKIDEYKDLIFKNEPNNPNYDSTLIENAWYKKEVMTNINLGNYYWTPVNDNEKARTQGLFMCQNIPSHVSFTEYFNKPPILCNKYVVKAPFNYFSPDRDPADNSISIYQKTIVYIQNSSFSGYTNAQVKEALSGTLLLYPLKEPRYIQMTDNTLINQLEDLYRIIIPGGTIVIETENEEENAQTIIAATALGKEGNE